MRRLALLVLFSSGCVSVRHCNRLMAAAELYGESRMLIKAIAYQTDDLTDEERLELLKMQKNILVMKNISGNVNWNRDLK